jgi:prepilin-type N-terminal cleavage/methylation domain-containing protein
MIRDPEQTGFTLVEVLITLVFLSMVAAIVFDSLGQVLDARARLRPYLDYSEETALVAGWFRQTVQALIADCINMVQCDAPVLVFPSPA